MITKLTEQQQAQIKKYRDMYMSLGMKTGRIDRPKAKALMRRIYSYLGYELKQVLFADSFYAAQKMAKNLNREAFNPTHIDGQFDAGWVAYHTYMVDVLGVDCEQKAVDGLRLFGEAVRELSFCITLEEVAILCERPKSIVVNADGLLHNSKGPSVEYWDGYSVYAIDGHVVPGWMIETPEKITVDGINGENNAEIRRIMRSIYGESRYWSEVNPEILDADSVDIGGGRGQMNRALIRHRQTGEVYLLGTDGSTERVYEMPVHEKTKTCVQAHNSISGFLESKCVAQS